MNKIRQKILILQQKPIIGIVIRMLLSLFRRIKKIIQNQKKHSQVLSDKKQVELELKNLANSVPITLRKMARDSAELRRELENLHNRVKWLEEYSKKNESIVVENGDE